MIDQIDIKNFQSHEDTTLELDPGVNVIVGLSDTGKSAIIRALKWLVFNRPLGEAFRSNWGGDTIISTSTEENIILRLKEKNFNGYKLVWPEKSDLTHKFKALGTDVPEEIQKALNISNLNLQGQVDPHFLFSSSPGEVATHINRITNLDKIDTGLKSLKSSLTKTEQDLKTAKQWRTDLEGQQESLKYVTALDGQLLVLEQAEGEVRQLGSTASNIKTLLEGIDSADKAVTERLWADAAGERVESLLEKQGKIKELRAKHGQISSVLVSLAVLEERTESLERMMGAESKLDNLQKKIQEKEDLEQRVKKLGGLVRGILGVGLSIQKKTISLKKLEVGFHRLMPETCPLCGQEVG